MFYKAAVNTELENIESLLLGEEDIVCGMGLRCELHPTPVPREKGGVHHLMGWWSFPRATQRALYVIWG